MANAVGSRIIGQSFCGRGIFPFPPFSGWQRIRRRQFRGVKLWSYKSEINRPGSASVADLQKENPGTPIPADLVTTSASGLDPDISPAAADFQVPRIARERQLSEESGKAVDSTTYVGKAARFYGRASG